MISNFFHTVPVMARQIVLWAIILALPFYGSSSALLQILGPIHRHVIGHAVPLEFRSADPLSQGVAWLAARWKDWQAYAHAQSHAGKLFVHAEAHHHDGFERHHHAANGDIVAIGAIETAVAALDDSSAAAGVGSATLPLGLATSLILPLPSAVARRWGRASPPIWRSATLRRRDRPPCFV